MPALEIRTRTDPSIFTDTKPISTSPRVEGTPIPKTPVHIFNIRHGRPERFLDKNAGLHLEGRLQMYDVADEIADEINTKPGATRIVVFTVTSPLLRAVESGASINQRLEDRQKAAGWKNVTIHNIGAREWVDTTDTIDDIIADGHDKGESIAIWESLSQEDMQNRGYKGRSIETVGTDLYAHIESVRQTHERLQHVKMTFEPEPHKYPDTEYYFLVAGHETGVQPLIKRETGVGKEVKPGHYARYDVGVGKDNVIFSQRPQH